MKAQLNSRKDKRIYEVEELDNNEVRLTCGKYQIICDKSRIKYL